MGNELDMGWTRMLPGTRATSARRAVEADGEWVGGIIGEDPVRTTLNTRGREALHDRGVRQRVAPQ